MRRRQALALALLLALFATSLTMSGCVDLQAEDVPDWVPDWMLPKAEQVETQTPEAVAPQESGWEENVDRHGRAMPTGSHGHGTEVLLLGRSVMQGWFDHWEWNGENPVVREGFALYYGELDSPPAIAQRAVEYVRNVPPTTIVAFKMCFVDFWARTPADAAVNLEENLGYVQEIVDAAEARGIRLVLMTALPETSANTNAALLDLHNDYDDALFRMAQEHDNVWVFDIRETLADQTGALYRGFATAPGDAHLTVVAYLELDDALFPFLDGTFPP